MQPPTGEHMLPTNAKLFAITQSSLTLLKTTSQFSSFYLTHYSAKPEEHSDARITSGKDGKHLDCVMMAFKINI